MYRISRLDDNTVAVSDENGVVCTIPVDEDTPITMFGGIEFLISRYKNNEANS